MPSRRGTRRHPKRNVGASRGIPSTSEWRFRRKKSTKPRLCAQRLPGMWRQAGSAGAAGQNRAANRSCGPADPDHGASQPHLLLRQVPEAVRRADSLRCSAGETGRSADDDSDRLFQRGLSLLIQYDPHVPAGRGGSHDQSRTSPLAPSTRKTPSTSFTNLCRLSSATSRPRRSSLALLRPTRPPSAHCSPSPLNTPPPLCTKQVKCRKRL